MTDNPCPTCGGSGVVSDEVADAHLTPYQRRKRNADAFAAFLEQTWQAEGSAEDDDDLGAMLVAEHERRKARTEDGE